MRRDARVAGAWVQTKEDSGIGRRPLHLKNLPTTAVLLTAGETRREPRTQRRLLNALKITNPSNAKYFQAQ